VDCGAGVGRVTGIPIPCLRKGRCARAIAKFTKVLQDSAVAKTGAVGTVLHQGSRDWYPEKKYDLIWTQWCVGHLMDSQLIDYTVRCRNALTENGLMVVKENLSTHNLGHDMYDDEDSSVTRTDAKSRQIFQAAGMTIINSDFAKGLSYPKSSNLLPVQSYALRPTTTD
jgi:protein N-terminal methyltransferase